MSNSNLATIKISAYTGNYTKGRTKKIKKITIHHMAGVLTAKRCGELFQAVGREGSSHYGIGNDGTIAIYVNEADTAWSDNNWNSNCESVSIEVSNSVCGGNWQISDAALKSLVKLVADIAKRNNLGNLVKGKTLTWHSMYAATTCPGNYLRSKMDYICTEANKLNSTKTECNGALDGTDKVRGSNELIVYFKGLSGNGKTGTNQWGYEVQIDKNGVVLENPHYSGNTKIPAGGKVLSGHGKAGEWIAKNIKKGYLVWFENGMACVAKGVHRSADTVNGARLADYLAIYTNGKTANTNPYGFEVAIDKNGKAHGTPIYGKGKMAIPSGGFVVSGHNEAGKWIYTNIKKGSTVIFDGRIVTIK